ncbi:hypothetical protein, partial [Mesorhizobium sp.]|uniref:hypothetical protein n=1 Tax=Mesorhizobium sp. TaxID=1871066 RepID=UPI0025DC645F
MLADSPPEDEVDLGGPELHGIGIKSGLKCDFFGLEPKLAGLRDVSVVGAKSQRNGSAMLALAVAEVRPRLDLKEHGSGRRVMVRGHVTNGHRPAVSDWLAGVVVEAHVNGQAGQKKRFEGAGIGNA